MSKFAHRLVAKVAQEMAGAVYDECALNNEWYKLNPSRKNFVSNVAPDMVEPARDTLIDMLGMPTVPEHQKAEIHEALMLDAALPRGPGQTMH